LSLSTLADKYCPLICRPVLNRVQRSPIGKQIVSGAFWSVVGNGFGKVFTFIAIIFVARILGKEAFGEFGLVRSTATMFVAFSSFGMGLTATKYIAELLYTDKERTGRIIGLTYVFTFFTSLLVAIIFYLVSPWICETQLSKPELTNVMRLGSVLLFLMTFIGTQTAVMTGFQDFRGLAITNFLTGLITIPIYVIGTYWAGIAGAIVAIIIVVSLNLIINCTFIYKNTKKYFIHYNFHQVYKEISILWKSNIPIVLSALIYSTVVWFSQLMLGAETNGKEELGIYYAVFNYQVIMLFILTQLLSVFLPIMSELNGKNNFLQYWSMVKKSWFLSTIITLVVVTPFLLLPKLFMGLYGTEFANSWITLQVACFIVIVSTTSNIVYLILITLGKNWTQMILCLVGKIIYIAIVYIMLKYHWGATGLFTAHIVAGISYLLLVVTTLSFDKKIRIMFNNNETNIVLK
jgi:O-antigen/teichoic acid export membrane protein